MPGPRALALCAGVAAAILVGPASAAAAGETFYAAPYGSGEACTEPAPCKIERAIEDAGDGDSVSLSGVGEYTIPIAGLTIAHEIAIGGAPGFPARIGASYPGSSLRVDGEAGARLHDLHLEGSNLKLESGIAERVYVAYPGSKEAPAPAAACELGDGVAMTESVCWAGENGELSEANGLEVVTGESAAQPVELRDVTAVASDLADESG